MDTKTKYVRSFDGQCPVSRNRPLIIVVNDRFIPRDTDAAHPFGVTGFILPILKELGDRKLLSGLILYKRIEFLNEPQLLYTHVNEMPAVRFCFNFKHSTSSLSSAFIKAINMLCNSHTYPNGLAIYHQTPTLLAITPPEIPCVVTHHGPFAHEVSRLFGRQFAEDAFGGGGAKFDHLIQIQAEGLRILTKRKNAIAIEMSEVQARVLANFGVPRERISVCAPLMSYMPALESASLFIDKDSEDQKPIHLIGAAARIDPFKQFQTFILAANQLYARGYRVRLCIYAGDNTSFTRRQQLVSLLRSELRPAATFHPSIPHAELLIHLAKLRHNSIFIFTSTYETFGLTPLEAILSGMTTIVPDAPNSIGIANLVPRRFRYSGGSAGLAKKIEEISSEASLGNTGMREREEVTHKLRQQPFIDHLLRNLHELSDTIDHNGG